MTCLLSLTYQQLYWNHHSIHTRRVSNPTKYSHEHFSIVKPTSKMSLQYFLQLLLCQRSAPLTLLLLIPSDMTQCFPLFLPLELTLLVAARIPPHAQLLCFEEALLVPLSLVAIPTLSKMRHRTSWRSFLQS